MKVKLDENLGSIGVSLLESEGHDARKSVPVG
jgi:hypothetical protein